MRERESEMKKKERFIKTENKGVLTNTEVWVDRETGVNYLFHQNGYAGGLTVLVGRDGKPIVTTVED